MKIAGISSVAPLLLVFLTVMAPGSAAIADDSEQMTPLLLAVQDAPVPFMGSDGRVHLVYELGMTNFSSADIAVEKVEVVSDGVTFANTRHRRGCRTPSARRPARIRRNHAQEHPCKPFFRRGRLRPAAKVPAELSHRVTLRASAAPVGHQEFGESGGRPPWTSDRLRDWPSAARRAVHFSGFLLRRHSPYASGSARQRPRVDRSTLRRGLGANGRERPDLCRPQARSSRVTPSLASRYWRWPMLSLSPSSMGALSKHRAVTPPTSRSLTLTETPSFLISGIGAMPFTPTSSRGASRFTAAKRFILVR